MQTITNSATRDELLDILRLTEKWSSEKDHRFYLYRPNPIMPRFHSSNASIRCLLGGNRSGKTTALIEDIAIQFLGEEPDSLKGLIPKHRLNPNRLIRLCMIDYPNAFEKVIWPKIQSLIPQNAIKSVTKEQGRIKSIHNHHNGFIEFMQYEQEVKKFQGASRDVIAYDEEPPEDIRDENQMRLIDRDGEEIFSLTPVAEENSTGYMPSLWIYDKIFTKAHKIFEYKDNALTLTVNPNAMNDVEVFMASIFDNKHLNHDAINRILSKFSKEEYQTRAFGYFTFLSGRIYNDFSETTHMIEPFNDWFEEETSNDYTLYLAIDPHPRTPHAVLFAVVDKYNNIYIVDELFNDFPNATSFVEAIKAKLMNKIPELIIIDPSAYIRNPSDNRCFAYDLVDAGLDPIPIKASKDLSRGIITTKKYITDKMLFVTNNCQRFRYEIMHYRWSNWSKNTATSKEMKQKPVDKDDHMMENLYRICLLLPTHNAVSEDVDELITQNKYKKNKYTGY